METDDVSDVPATVEDSDDDKAFYAAIRATAVAGRGGPVIREPAPTAPLSEKEGPVTYNRGKARVEASSSRSSAPKMAALHPSVVPRGTARAASKRDTRPNSSRAGPSSLPPSSLPEYYPVPGWTMPSGDSRMEFGLVRPSGAIGYPIPETYAWIPRHQADQLLLMIGALRTFASDEIGRNEAATREEDMCGYEQEIVTLRPRLEAYEVHYAGQERRRRATVPQLEEVYTPEMFVGEGEGSTCEGDNGSDDDYVAEAADLRADDTSQLA
ncbi:uncharacterized protein LOC143881169 [Tasmannia lanceolata]|uniref:uncharacterized protein LOC143881169 n=1 Tax=Tasmannia lanceolata TaxID=3420 RepID=UPI004062C1C0